MIRKIFSKALMCGAVLSLATPALVSQAQDLSAAIPVDSKVTVGKLSNGLTYYIRPNSKPENKVELRLVVNAGSILENDNQQGLAHFMEHMNFNGLKHYPKNELVNYLQKIGVQFGADLNANTGWDRTYYMLPIPTDNPTNLDNGFQIVADWAGGALITTDEVNDERNVILEELRMREKTADYRMLQQAIGPVMNGSRYADRLPGGKENIIAKEDPERIREYYRDWYRPDNMAVIVVGDITTEKAKAMVEKYFNYLKNPSNEKNRTYYDVKPYNAKKGLIVSDPEATNYDLQIIAPAQPKKVENNLGDYRTDLIRNIFTQAMNKRFRDLTQTDNPPFTQAFGGYNGYINGITLKSEAFELNVTPVDNIKTAVDAAVGELSRIQQFGFTDAEVQTVKSQFLSQVENAYNERNTTPSADYTEEYADNFMEAEPIPGIDNEYNYIKEMLPNISLKEINDYATNTLHDNQNYLAVFSGPTSGRIKLPTESELLSMVGDAFKQTVTQKAATVTASSLLENEPVAGKIVSETKDADLDATTYTLSNGVLVTVKPTDFKSDEILFSGVKKGGMGLYGTEDLGNATFLSPIISSMGYGQFTPTALRDFLAGKNARVSAAMGQASDAVNGSSSVKDLETLLQLNYLQLISPRKDDVLFKGFITKIKSSLQMIKANPQTAFIDTMGKVMYNNSPLAPIQVPSEQVLSGLSSDRAIQIYKDQFGNADGFHFFIVGNVDENSIKPLIEKYIASLPAKGTQPAFKDNGLRAVTGEKTFKFSKGNDQKSLVIVQYNGDVPYSQDLDLKSDILGQALDIEMTENIREKLALMYSGEVETELKRVPYSHYNLLAVMPCGPKNVDKVLAEFNKEVEGFKKDGISDVNLEKVKKALLEKDKENMKNNGYWMSGLQEIMVWGNSKDYLLNYGKYVNAVTKADIKTTANQLFGKNIFTAISYPEKIEETDATDKK